MRTIRTKPGFIQWYFGIIASTYPAQVLERDDLLDYSLKIQVISHAVGMPELNVFKMPMLGDLSGESVFLASEQFTSFLSAASDAIDRNKELYISRRRLIDLMLAAFPCNGLHVQTDYDRLSSNLVSAPPFVSQHRVKVSVRLGWIKETPIVHAVQQAPTSSTIISLDRFRIAHAAGCGTQTPRLSITSPYELYLFLRGRLDAIKPTKQYRRKKVERARRWADRPARAHPLWKRSSDNISHAPKHRVSERTTERSQKGDDANGKCWCSLKMLRYATELELRYRLNRSPLPIGESCFLLASVLDMFEHMYLRTKYEDGYCWIIGTRKLERRFGVRVRVQLMRVWTPSSH